MPETKDTQCGLYWKKPDKEEKVVTRCKTERPVLNEIKGKRLEKKDTGSDQTSLIYDHTKEVKLPTHVLIEGDNYHALTVLNFTHKEKIDIIYIDPPYNTGNNGFIYSDRRIDKENLWRHSCWLSFMHKRLFLARQLLKETGVMFISIDDNEMAQLKLLCDEIFGEDNVEIMIWKKSEGKLKVVKRFRREHEYIIVAYKNKHSTMFNKLYKEVKGTGNISNTPEKSNKKSKNYYEITSPTGKVFERQWYISKEEFLELEKEGSISWGNNGDSVPRIQLSDNHVWPESIIQCGSVTEAERLMEEIFGTKKFFSNPKPVSLLKHLLKIASSEKSIILDFFAGSGTTGHAVLELNEEDGGNRQFILCTDNENKICTEICYPRIYKVMKGYVTPDGKKIEGLEGSLKYYKTAFENDDE